jgi:hypothetical protein
MIEAIASRPVLRYLKPYFEPVDSNQMKLKLSKGSAKLQDFELAESALPCHAIPLVVRKGTVKDIVVKFPWQNIRNKPTIVDICEVFLALASNGSISLHSGTTAGSIQSVADLGNGISRRMAGKRFKAASSK